jgi:hypothetical protein
VRTNGFFQSDEKAVQLERKVAHPISRPQRARREATRCLVALIEWAQQQQRKQAAWIASFCPKPSEGTGAALASRCSLRISSNQQPQASGAPAMRRKNRLFTQANGSETTGVYFKMMIDGMHVECDQCENAETFGGPTSD